MIFALVNGSKQRATKGAKGICPICDELLIPKCGNYRIHHWSHKNGTDCDSWSEGETEWHLAWKDHFEAENQEVVVTDERTGEKHRADIKTDNNMVIELQHSPISDSEISLRTTFYKKMIWIIDGNNFGFVKQDFFQGISRKEPDSTIIDFTYFGRSKIFEKWIKVKVPVFIDFSENFVFWLKKYDQKTKKGIVQAVTKAELIEKNGGKKIQIDENTNNVEMDTDEKTPKITTQYQRIRAYQKKSPY